MPDSSPIVIFDGVCNFCNYWVNFILERDKKQRFKFAANQSEAGKKILAENHIVEETPDTVYLYQSGKLYARTAAVLRITIKLGFPWVLMGFFFIFPAFLRDPVYNLIAKNRYRWWGKLEACRMPRSGEEERFLL